MNGYELQYTLQSVGESATFMEFSPDGRFLVIGGREPARLRVFDRWDGFLLAVEADTASYPTSLTFESSATFLVGFNDGRFVEYTIDLGSKRLVKGWTNNTLRGASCVTAIALDETSQILTLAQGPSVLVFSRISKTGKFQFTANISKHLNFEGEPIPRSLCFSSDDRLHIAFSEQHVASVKLVRRRRSGLQTMVPAIQVDYSGISILRTILFSNEEPPSGFGRFWIYGNGGVPHEKDDNFAFLLINGGAATLSASPSGRALIKDVVTRRPVQSLKHDGSAPRPLIIAYNSGKTHYSIATASLGLNGTVKIWTADRISTFDGGPSGIPKARSRRSCSLVVGLAIIASLTILLSNGFVFHKHQLRVHLARAFILTLNWVLRCGTATAYIAATVGGTLEKWYRDAGGAFLLFIEESFGGR